MLYLHSSKYLEYTTIQLYAWTLNIFPQQLFSKHNTGHLSTPEYIEHALYLVSLKYQHHVLCKHKHMLHVLQLISLFECESLIYIAIFPFNSLSFLWGKSHFPAGGSSNRSPAYSVICCFKPKCGVSKLPALVCMTLWICSGLFILFV